MTRDPPQWFKILRNGFGLQELPEDCFPALAEEDEDVEEGGVSQSVPSELMSSQDSASGAVVLDVIVIDTDSESHESKEGEEQPEDDDGEEDEEEEEEEDDDDDDDDGVLFCLLMHFK